MDRGAWQATVHGVTKPSNQTAIQLVGGSIEQSVFSHKQVFAWIFFSSNESSVGSAMVGARGGC